jgi:hypothetical protein
MSKQKIMAGVALALALFLGVQAGTTAFAGGKKKAAFKVRIENVSDKDGLAAADGSKYPFAVSPGLYAVTSSKLELFAAGKKSSMGLEAQAEDGSPDTLYNWVLDKKLAGSFGVFNKPNGSDMPGPLLPGGVYEFTFDAVEGDKLNLIMMYGQSNDLFYAPAQAVELFQHRIPLTGDLTNTLELWDAGTEVNEAPGIGADQAPRQKMKNTGADENGVAGLVRDGFTYPSTKDVLRVTITAN